MHKVVASWFGTGLIVRALVGSDSGSGTVGSIFALALSVWMTSVAVWVQVVGGLAVLALAIWSIRPLAATEGDAGWIVIDEAAGMFVATVSLTLVPAIVAFVVFRAADIFKERFPGVARAERIRGTTGIISDDLVAGLYGLAAGLIVMSL